MPAVPKKKTPKSRQGKHRSHQHVRLAALTKCPHCHAPRPSHQVCPSCGYYKDRQAVTIGKPELPTT
jgi:large subunit ribosomal protein L32